MFIVNDNFQLMRIIINGFVGNLFSLGDKQIQQVPVSGYAPEVSI
jgi:hypothetical protein